MIELITLLTGLLVGPQALELRATPEVVRVEAWLDGDRIATRDAPPWRLEIDLGDTLAPHRLDLRAFDAAGAPIATVRRALNGARPTTDDEATSTPLQVVFDGATPDPEQLADVFAVGGQTLEVVRVGRGSPRIALVLTPDARSRLEDLAESYLKNHVVQRSSERQTSFRRPWNPAVLENPERFLDEAEPLFDVGGRRRQELDLSQLWGLFERSIPWPEGTRIRLVNPLAAPVSRLASSTRVFNVSRRGSADGGGLLFHAVQARPRIDFDLRLADAVAVAALGLRSPGEGRSADDPLAVVVLVGDDGEDASRFGLDAVRTYLAQIDVALFVAGWRDGETLATLWGPGATDLRPATRRGETLPGAQDALDPLEEAAAGWRQTLERQAVVWLAGDHRRSEVRLRETQTTPRAVGVRRAVQLPSAEVPR